MTHSQRGFTIVELLVALIVLSIGALAGAASLAAAARAQSVAATRRAAVAALRSQVTLLALKPCSQLAGGAAQVNGVTITWTVAMTDSLAAVRLVAQTRATTTVLQTEVACE